MRETNASFPCYKVHLNTTMAICNPKLWLLSMFSSVFWLCVAQTPWGLRSVSFEWPKELSLVHLWKPTRSQSQLLKYMHVALLDAVLVFSFTRCCSLSVTWQPELCPFGGQWYCDVEVTSGSYGDWLSQWHDVAQTCGSNHLKQLCAWKNMLRFLISKDMKKRKIINK